MVQAWTKQGARGTTHSAHDAATLALHVLTYTGLGIRYNFSKEEQGDGEEGMAADGKLVPPPHKLSYQDALNIVLRSFTIFAILPKRVLSSPFLPANIQRVGEACSEFELYMKELVQEEKKKVTSSHQIKPGDQAAAGGGGGGDENLLRALVRASEAASDSAASPGRAGLSDDELYGNLFVYNLGM